MSDRAPQDQDKYVLRFPDGMRDLLKELAADNGRSLNAEIIARLQDTLDPNSPSLERLAFFEDQYEQAAVERGKLYDALNNQERLVQQMQHMHRNFVIVAKGLGKVFLEDKPDDDFTRKALATILMTLEDDDTSDPSEPVDRQAWER